MKIIPTGESLGVTQAQGQGYAQVLGGSNFDPVNFVQNLVKEKKAEDLAKRKEELDRRAEWAKIGVPNIKDVNEFNRQELEKAVGEYGNMATSLMMAGVDPNTNYEARTRLAQAELGLQQLANDGKEIENIVARNAKEAVNFPKQKWDLWKSELDAKPTLKEKLEYARGNNPFKKRESIVDIITETIPADKLREKLESSIGGNRTKITEQANEVAVDQFVDDILFFEPATKARMDSLFEAGFEDGLWKNAEEFRDYVKKQVVLYSGQKKEELQGNVITNFGGRGSSTTDEPNTEITSAGITTKPKVIPEKDTIDPTTQRPIKGLQSLTQSDDPEDLMDIAETDLEGANSDVSGVFVVNVKDNTQTREGNFIDAYGKPVTGKVNGFKFSKDGSLWVYVSNQVLPLVPSRRIKNQAIKDKGNANAQQVAKSLGRDWNEIKNEIYNKKEGKSSSATPTTSSLGKGVLDNIGK